MPTWQFLMAAALLPSFFSSFSTRLTLSSAAFIAILTLRFLVRANVSARVRMRKNEKVGGAECLATYLRT